MFTSVLSNSRLCGCGVCVWVSSWGEKHLDGGRIWHCGSVPWRRLPSVPQPAAPRRSGSPKVLARLPMRRRPRTRWWRSPPRWGASSASRCRSISRQYQPPPPPPPHPSATSEVTGTVHSGGHWDWQGGTPVVVAQGETITAIAHRHNVPAHEIMRANGLTASATLQAGQRLVIPRYVADGGSAKLAHAALPRHPASPVAAASPAVAAPTAATPGDHVVASGETLSSIARKHRITIRELATANSMTPETPLKVGMKLNVPARTGAATKTASLGPVAPTTVVTARPRDPAVGQIRRATRADRAYRGSGGRGDGGRARSGGRSRHADVPLAVARPGDHEFRLQDRRAVRATASTSPSLKAPPFAPPMTASSPMPATSSRATAISC